VTVAFTPLEAMGNGWVAGMSGGGEREVGTVTGATNGEMQGA